MVSKLKMNNLQTDTISMILGRQFMDYLLY